MTTALRPATAADLPAVGALHHRSRAAAYRDVVPAEVLAALPLDAMRQWWTERWGYERETHEMTVAERDGTVVGFSYVGPTLDDPVTGTLYAIHLEPAEQGRGTGRLLMVDALDRLRRRGYGRAELWVVAGNTHARTFYERGGWTADGAVDTSDFGPDVPVLRYVRALP